MDNRENEGVREMRLWEYVLMGVIVIVVNVVLNIILERFRG